MQGAVLERLDGARSPVGRFDADETAGRGSAGSDDSGASGTGQEAAGSRHANGREPRGEAGADDRGEETRRQTDHQAAADGGETHHDVPPLEGPLSAALHVILFVPILLLGVLLHLECIRDLLLEPANVNPGDLEVLGYPLQQDARSSVVDRVGDQHEEQIAEDGPPQIDIDLGRVRELRWRPHGGRELGIVVCLVRRWRLRGRLVVEAPGTQGAAFGLVRGRARRISSVRGRILVLLGQGVLDAGVRHQGRRQIRRHYPVGAELLDHDLLGGADVHVRVQADHHLLAPHHHALGGRLDLFPHLPACLDALRLLGHDGEFEPRQANIGNPLAFCQQVLGRLELADGVALRIVLVHGARGIVSAFKEVLGVVVHAGGRVGVVVHSHPRVPLASTTKTSVPVRLVLLVVVLLGDQFVVVVVYIVGRIGRHDLPFAVAVVVLVGMGGGELLMRELGHKGVTRGAFRPGMVCALLGWRLLLLLGGLPLLVGLVRQLHGWFSRFIRAMLSLGRASVWRSVEVLRRPAAGVLRGAGHARRHGSPRIVLFFSAVAVDSERRVRRRQGILELAVGIRVAVGVARLPVGAAAARDAPGSRPC